MNSTKCIICAKPFPHRRGKAYCSNSCKQRAYLNKKSGGDHLPIGTISNQVFYLEDYNAFLQSTYCRYDTEFIAYCFCIKNFGDDEFSYCLNEIAGELITESFLRNIHNPQHPVGRQFLQFQNEFHLGNYKVLKSKPVMENEK